MSVWAKVRVGPDGAWFVAGLRVRLGQLGGFGHIRRAVLGFACLEVGRLREARQLTLGRRASVPLLESPRASTQVRGDGLAASREHAHHLPADALDLETVSIIAGDPFQAEPGGEGFFQVLGDDRGAERLLEFGVRAGGPQSAGSRRLRAHSARKPSDDTDD
jgi:hypothetical protein